MSLRHVPAETLAIGLVAAAYAAVIGYVGGDTDATLLLTMVLVAIALCLQVSPMLSGQPSVVSVDHYVLAGFVLLLLVLVYTSTFSRNSLAIGWRLATFALVFFICFRLKHDRWQFALLLFLLTGATSAAWGVIEFFYTGTRANGPVNDPSTWGTTQNLYFFALAALYFSEGRNELGGWKRAAFVGGLLLFALASCVAYSRVGTAIFFSGVALTVGVFAIRPALRRRAGIIAIVALVAFITVSSRAGFEEASGHEEGFTLDLESFGWSQRILMWESALDIYAEYPVFGSGPGTFKLHYPRYRSPDELSNSGNYVHNDYLQFLSEGGPLLLSFLLLFSSWLCWLLVRKVYQVTNGEDGQAQSLLLVIALGSALAHALVNFPLYQFQVLMLMGLIYARVAATSSAQREVVLEVESATINRAALIVIPSIGITLVSLDVLSRDLLLDDNELPLTQYIESDRELYFAIAETLAVIRSQNATNRFAMATLYRIAFDQIDPVARPGARTSLGVATALEYQRGVELNPWNFLARRYLAELLEQNPWLMNIEGIYVTPADLYREGIAIAPTRVAPYLEYADWLVANGREDQAYQLLVREALPWVNHRYDDWRDHRETLLSRLSREARARNDHETLRRVLSLVDR